MRKNVRLNRRQVLGVTAGTLTVGFAGCLGGGGDDGGDSGGGENSGDDTENTTTNQSQGESSEDVGPDDIQEYSEQELITMFKESFITALNSGNVDEVNELIHSESDLKRFTNDESQFYGPQFDVGNVQILSKEEDKLILEADMSYELNGEDLNDTWTIEFRPDDITWGIWSIESSRTRSEPALSPEVAVEEFVTALNEGDVATVNEKLHEDAYVPDTIAEQPENYEGIIELIDTEVLERGDGEAIVETTVKVSSNGETQEIVWELALASVDRTWKIGFNR